MTGKKDVWVSLELRPNLSLSNQYVGLWSLSNSKDQTLKFSETSAKVVIDRIIKTRCKVCDLKRACNPNGRVVPATGQFYSLELYGERANHRDCLICWTLISQNKNVSSSKPAI